MSANFKAIVINQDGENFKRGVQSVDREFLKHGNVLVKVDYSTLNYKDALILKNGARLVKEFPHIPGIDFSGKVVESQNENFKGVMRLFQQAGGLAKYISVVIHNMQK